MPITHFRHKGLRLLFEEDRVRGVPTEMVDRLRKLLLALDTAENVEQLDRYPGWRLHATRES